ncbi:MAG: hypothetical protein K6U12_03950 [Armatimonadetes bacterium]|nr:hypothetical protein [Armatimonadota bacterium]CUU37505.1 Verru_Chthon cassette protein B [Armatimonadetes bacterium DC]
MTGRDRIRAGASLVEVLVAVGVLTIAILAFIRLYPSGFLALKRSGQSEAATRLAQREMERLKMRRESLPYAIAPIRYQVVNGDVLMELDPTVSPDDLGVQPDLPNGVPPEYASGVNRMRRVIGERATLGLPGALPGSMNQITEGILYTTTFAPIALPPEPLRNNPNVMANYLQVYGNPMRRFVMDSDYQWRNLQVFDYGIDYENGLILLRPLRNRPISYKVDYTYLVAHGDHYDVRQVSTVIRLAPTAPNPPYAVWVPLTVPVAGEPPENFQPVNQMPGFGGIVPDSDSCARLFEMLNANASWDPEYPYQYKVVNPLLGTLMFSPHASGAYERYWRGERPLNANIDYTVQDWSIISEELTVPTSLRLRLVFTDLKQFGDLQNDQTLYPGLRLGGDLTPLPSPDQMEGNPAHADVVVIDLISGQSVFIQKGQAIRGGLNTPVSVDYGAGIIEFGDRAWAGRKVRVLYKVHDNWAMSVQKAVQRYFISAALVGMPIDACWYDFEGAYNRETTPRQRRLYFNKSEAGKTIQIREYWYQTRDGAIRHGTNGVFRISEATEPVDGGEYVYVDLTQLHPDAVRWAPEVTGTALRGVQGLSLKVRLTYEVTGTGRPVRLDFDQVLSRAE